MKLKYHFYYMVFYILVEFRSNHIITEYMQSHVKKKLLTISYPDRSLRNPPASSGL
jgi:hypothetical protein